MPFFGWLADRYHYFFRILNCAILAGFLVAIFVVFFHGYGFYFQLGTFFILAFSCSSQSLGYVLITKINPSESQGRAMATGNVIIVLTSATLPLLFNIFSHVSYVSVKTENGFLFFGMLVIPFSLLISMLILNFFKNRLQLAKL